MGRCWSEVPSEVIYLLAERMTSNLTYLVTLGTVCKTWESLLVESQWLGYAEQLEALVGAPSLILPKLMFGDYTVDNYSNTMKFNYWGQGKIFKLQLPDRGRKKVCGAGNGWMVITYGDMNVYLLNPITREQINLPSPVSFDAYDISLFGKAIIIGNPCKAGDCTVAAIFHDWLVMTKPRCDETWTMVKTQHMLCDIVHYGGLLGGLLCGTTYSSEYIEIWTMDPAVKLVVLSLATPIPNCWDRRYDSYLLQVSGAIIKVARPIEKDGKDRLNESVIVVRINGHGWEEVKNLGDCCLLLAEKASMALSPVPPQSAFRKNCIYFSRPDLQGKYNMSLYNMDTMSYESFSLSKHKLHTMNPSFWIIFNPEIGNFA